MSSLVFWLLIIGVIIVARGLKVIDQYERGVVLTLGKFSGIRNPGLTFIIPFIQRILKVDMRLTTIDIPKQEVITRDNVPAQVNGVLYFMVEKPENAIIGVQNYMYAISQYAQAALRDVVGGVELDTLLTERDKIANEIEKIVEKETADWGVKTTAIKIQDIELPMDMKRLMAKQAEAERERRAVIIRAEGELTASENLRKAAENLTAVPGGLSLRTLTTIESVDKSTIWALPIEILEGFKAIHKKSNE
ncbi:slipin family protein [Candidatus Uhrbacteria bacterium]|nr:slipin family protein [Candidatus Uhrbacteria bacterium]